MAAHSRARHSSAQQGRAGHSIARQHSHIAWQHNSIAAKNKREKQRRTGHGLARHGIAWQSKARCRGHGSHTSDSSITEQQHTIGHRAIGHRPRP